MAKSFERELLAGGSRLAMVAAGLMVMAGVSGAAFAQTPAPQQAAPAASDDKVEEIIVTGSRIARDPNAIAPLPISTLNADDLRAAGNADVTATIRQIPALISSGTVADSIERGAGGVGQATLNLRQLGANRTLVLVDGYRHVSGVAGQQTVDVSTIPSALIERVDVLTGGASAVYGADAVTGVVNYVLRKDFEGVAIDAQTGISSEGDGETYKVDITVGNNFAGGKGNVTFSAGYTNENEVLLGDRSFTENNGRANNSTTYANPLRRFQVGDINPATMPNFAARFSRAAGRLNYGFAIPSAADAARLWPGGLTAAEQALIQRAADAPLFVIARDPRFAISSGEGLIFRNDFGFFNADINNNGINDCRESYIGLTGFGGGGCYVSTGNGGVRIFQDGVISTGSNQFGGDGAVERTNATSLTPESDRSYANLRANYEFTPAFEAFIDGKYARNETLSRNNYNTFYDSLFIAPDNPFIPAVLRNDARQAGGLRVSRDMLDLGAGIQDGERETYRIVGGLRGEITEWLNYEVSGNYGRSENEVTNQNAVQYDRLFAALDVVTGPNGRPTCRSEITPTALHPGSEIFPVIAPGFFTFRPGQGACIPVSLFNGTSSITPEAAAWITTPTTNEFTLEQTVFNLTFTGDSGAFFSLPGGPVQFAAGAEYRKEESKSVFDPLLRGLLPAGSPAGAAGTFIGDISPNQSLIFDAQTRSINSGGDFDVKEIFGELSLPILSDVILFDELTVGGAVRYAEYSTAGDATTWNLNGTWAPIEDVRFRASYAQAIRAPNIQELFDPAVGATFRPNDPCNASTRRDLVRTGAANAANRERNCLAAVQAAGIPNAAAFLANYEDPLTARFSGTISGNPNLDKEQADTWTVGGVIQPRFIPGLTLSLDYYSIKIEDAIALVAAQDIVNTCYDLDTFPNQFCGQFQRNVFNPGAPTQSPTLFGFRTLNQTQLNFGKLETSGVDFTVAYRFSLGENDFALRVSGNWTEKLDRFFDPVNTSLVNPGLKELGAPEYSGLGSFTYARGGFSFTYGVQYIGEQAVASAIQIERIAREFGPEGMAPEYWVQNASASYEINEEFTVYGGVNNITNVEPYRASSAYPVSGVGRYFFVGVQSRF